MRKKKKRVKPILPTRGAFASGDVFYLFLFAFCLSASSCSVQKQLSRSAVKTVLGDSSLSTAHVGIHIFEPERGKTWFDYQGDKYFVPASNTKIPTCYAAMKYLGDSLAGLMVGTNGDAGKLYIKGTGDPTFLHKDFPNQPVFDFLKAQGKRLVLTNPNFFAGSLGSGWSWNDYNESYMAERSGLPVYGNTSLWELADWPGKSIYELHVTPKFFADSLSLIPPDFATANSLDTISRTDYFFEVRRNKGNNTYSLAVANGRFHSARIPFETTNSHTIAKLLADTLHLPVESDQRKWIYQRRLLKSQTADSLLKPMMHRSDNFFAEQSLLMVSNELLGYMSDAIIIDSLLKTDFKDLPQPPRWVDGSGLSRYNLFSPRDFVFILHKMYREFEMDRVKTIFPTGGEGTLTNYYQAERNYIYAKTGTLSGVVSLSGFLYTRKNKLLIFSVLVNNHHSSAPEIRRAVESFLRDLRNRY